MGESTYAAMREFIKLAVEVEVQKAVTELRASLPTETRAVEPVVGPPGKDGSPGKDGVDGKDGVNGKDGKDGIATREDLRAAALEINADLQVRNLADSWRGVWTPDVEYQRGTVAQWDGSPWLALLDTKTKPGTSHDWVLFAKKGRDGRK